VRETERMSSEGRTKGVGPVRKLSLLYQFLDSLSLELHSLQSLLVVLLRLRDRSQAKNDGKKTSRYSAWNLWRLSLVCKRVLSSSCTFSA
jgi:hypothetical protein